MSYLSALKATRHALLDAQRHLLTVDCIRPTPALPADVADLADALEAAFDAADTQEGE